MMGSTLSDPSSSSHPILMVTLSRVRLPQNSSFQVRVGLLVFINFNLWLYLFNMERILKHYIISLLLYAHFVFLVIESLLFHRYYLAKRKCKWLIKNHIHSIHIDFFSKGFGLFSTQRIKDVNVLLPLLLLDSLFYENLLLLKFLQLFLNCCRVELAKKSLTLKVIYDVLKSMDKDEILIKEV